MTDAEVATEFEVVWTGSTRRPLTAPWLQRERPWCDPRSASEEDHARRRGGLVWRNTPE